MDVFYLRCISKKPADEDIWYECSPVGKEQLRRSIEVMCREAGISEKTTNHSLRATGATAFSSAGVPEKLIRDVTGHRSIVCQLYERPSLAQKEAVSNILVQFKERGCSLRKWQNRLVLVLIVLIKVKTQNVSCSKHQWLTLPNSSGVVPCLGPCSLG